MRLIDGARDVIRAKGYAATTIDDLCAAAGISKGGFFHHFVSKEQLGLAAIQRFNDMASHLFRAAPFAGDADPRSRLLGYIDFRISILSCDVVQYTCLLGTMVQEVHATHPFLRDACAAGMAAHVAALTHDIEEAKQRHAPDAHAGPEQESCRARIAHERKHPDDEQEQAVDAIEQPGKGARDGARDGEEEVLHGVLVGEFLEFHFFGSSIDAGPTASNSMRCGAGSLLYGSRLNSMPESFCTSAMRTASSP